MLVNKFKYKKKINKYTYIHFAIVLYNETLKFVLNYLKKKNQKLFSNHNEINSNYFQHSLAFDIQNKLKVWGMKAYIYTYSHIIYLIK